MKVTPRPEGPVRVLYVITKANWGGAQRYVYDLALAAQAAHYEVSVAYGVPGGLSERLAQDGMPLFPLTAFGRDIDLIGEIKTFFRLLQLCLKERPDIVHVN